MSDEMIQQKTVLNTSLIDRYMFRQYQYAAANSFEDIVSDEVDAFILKCKAKANRKDTALNE